LPNKPLLEIAGRPLIEWVWERARASGAASVVVAGDDPRILEAARRFGADCALTGAHHASGTDRIAEVVRSRGLSPEEIVVNLQGDEPMMPPAAIARVARALEEHPRIDIATAVAPIRSLSEFLDPSCVKALADRADRALYFSRAPVPWPREHSAGGRPQRFEGALRHIGLYGFRVRTLLRFAALPPTPLEQSEKLEQLRALEHGLYLHLVRLEEVPPAGVDTPEDLERVRREIG
jgi:3-deoxy-manno-octulosonate cytidylyltransferase (CMP-KDO synthetase)